MAIEVELDVRSERFIAECIASGRYGSADEVAVAALQLFENRRPDERGVVAGSKNLELPCDH